MTSTTAHELANRQPVGIVVAMTRNRVIGQEGKLPWDLPADRRLFRRLTEGNTVIMGRRTFDSLPAALPNRHNIVLSRTVSQRPEATVCPDFRAAVVLAHRLGHPIFVIGGVEIYRQALPVADTLHISWVEGDYTGDRRFPSINLDRWAAVEVAVYPGFEHVTYRRRP